MNDPGSSGGNLRKLYATIRIARIIAIRESSIQQRFELESNAYPTLKDRPRHRTLVWRPSR